MKITKKDYNAKLNTAEKLLNNGEYDKALDIFKHLALAGDSSKIQQFIGQIYLLLGRIDEALKNFKNQARLDPESKEAYFFIGNCCFMLKKYIEAIKAFEKSIDIYPDNPYAFDNMANAWEELKMYNNSLDARKKASELKPEDAYIKCNMANTLSKLELNEEAMQVYKEAASLNPKFPEVFYHMGNCLCSMEDYKQAIQSYSMAIELDPFFIDALNNLGNAYFDIGNHEQSLLYYTRAKEIDSQNAEVLNNLGDLYSVLGDSDNALDCYNNILDNYNDELVENLLKCKKERCPIHPSGYVLNRQKHYRKFIGEFSRVLHTIAEDKKPFIDIYEIPPQKGRYFWTYITGGMSDISQNTNVDTGVKSTAHTELVIYTNEKSVWARKVLYNLAYFPFLNNTYIHYSSTAEFDFSLIEGSEMKNAIILDSQAEEKGFFDFELEGKKVNFLRVQPISDSELRYKNANGLSAFLNLLTEKQVDFVVDIMRKPVI